VFAGADLVSYYSMQMQKHQRAKWFLRNRWPIIFFSTEHHRDIQNVRDILEKSNVQRRNLTVKSIKENGVVPAMEIILENKTVLSVIIHEVSCNSYYPIPIKGGNTLRIASLDTLITLYLGMSFVGSRIADIKPMHCLANELVEISRYARKNPNSFPFPFISIECMGHQRTKPSLIRSKLRRMKTAKGKIREMLQSSIETATNSNTSTKAKKPRRKTVRQKHNSSTKND
jgi:hypothetical protein